MATVITPPAFEPVTVQEAKRWLRVDHSEDDALIGSLIRAAREWVEHYTNTAFAQRTLEVTGYRMVYGAGPGIGPIEEVVSVTVGDTTLAPADYYLSQTYPYDTVLLHARATDVLTVRVKVGEATVADDVPDVVKVAMQLIITENYEKRTDRIRKMPTAAENLLNPVRRWV
ncbi:head-tail connector protein [Lewinella sp. JB7]|uniref:head-tail connector protein n=1 Tax=Lewinella sp. JB7 TaxID=2962887 RepID=UPI0020C9E393|nr:head-tail connector protein [Lewinella sp. JB7]MCP9237153.1 head-tail connector protein [Lewinella sp. JB7]